MRLRFICVTFATLVALLAASCASSTVVERAERPASSEEENATNQPSDTADDGSGGTDDAEDPDSSGDPGGAEDPDSSDDTDDATEESNPTSAREIEESAGYGLGGPEQLADLLADCEDGVDQACDILLPLSGFDSIEETAALTCGGRAGESSFCTSGIRPDPKGDNLYFDEASPALTAIQGACETGDMTACDFLYFRSPVGSEYEATGNTCGGRTAVALPDCRTFFDE